MTHQKKISILVLMHNNVAMTISCLEHLSAAVRDLDHEVILMDNASTEDTVPVKECDRIFKKIVHCRSHENLPFSVVNNRGAAKATGSCFSSAKA
jgi:GT2 family glycosyltransferase